MWVLGHITEVETTTFILVFALGLISGLAGGYGLAYWRGRHTKDQ